MASVGIIPKKAKAQEPPDPSLMVPSHETEPFGNRLERSEEVAPREPLPDDEFARTIGGLSPETQRQFHQPPPPEEKPGLAVIISVEPPRTRYGGKERSPKNLREAPAGPEGYTRGTRFGDQILDKFGQSRQRRPGEEE